MRHPIVSIAILLASIALPGCIVLGDEDEPITAKLIPAVQSGPATDVVVVLPGIGADAERMEEHGVAAAIHKSWPQADVLLTNATFAYYVHNVLVEKLHHDVIEPTRQRYKKVWLAGASVGGMGALLYERAHPREMAGIVLFAPWLGDADLQDEIRAAGGIAKWNAGPVPEKVNGDNYQREMWRVVQGWSQDPQDAQRVWLVCGKDDRLLEADRLLATAIPASHYLEVDGGHTWEAWLTAAELLIAKLRAA
jgi:enterochelin esterase-like enzyme